MEYYDNLLKLYNILVEALQHPSKHQLARYHRSQKKAKQTRPEGPQALDLLLYLHCARKYKLHLKVALPCKR
eukprot:2158002-Amphidinium_carterae.1